MACSVFAMMGEVGAARASDDQSHLVVAQPAPAKSDQTASIPTLLDAMPPSAVPFKLETDALRSEQAAADQARSADFAWAPDTDQTGARLVPMFKTTDPVQDPNNRASFTDKHEFGIELRGKFW